MRLDRYIGEHAGKFSIIENRKGGRVVNIGDPVDDFFVIKLKDRNAPRALREYANAAEEDGDHELAADVRRLALEAENHPARKSPD